MLFEYQNTSGSDVVRHFIRVVSVFIVAVSVLVGALIFTF